jgi:hypothetical protein
MDGLWEGLKQRAAIRAEEVPESVQSKEFLDKVAS